MKLSFIIYHFPQFLSSIHRPIWSILKNTSGISLFPCGFDPYLPLHPSIRYIFIKLVSSELFLTQDRLKSITSRSSLVLYICPTWRNNFVWSLNTHDVVSKQSPNLLILRSINEFTGIMVNKGRIHREIRKFERYHRNSIKSDDELSLKIWHFIILRKITQLRIHGIKNWMIWMRIHRVIEVWRWVKISIAKRIKNQN